MQESIDVTSGKIKDKSKNTARERLFVYGSLAPGRINHDVVAPIPGIWTEATLKGHLISEVWGSEMGYPGIIPARDGEEVKGYIFSSGKLSKRWSQLDEFEGNGYSRKIVEVKTESGRSLRLCMRSIKTAFNKLCYAKSQTSKMAQENPNASGCKARQWIYF